MMNLPHTNFGDTMQFILQNNSGQYIKLDFDVDKSSSWRSSITDTEEYFGIENTHSWRVPHKHIAAGNTIKLLDYMSSNYMIISTDVKDTYEFW
jgi:hypothetical protein